jgi:hypothetical protein
MNGAYDWRGIFSGRWPEDAQSKLLDRTPRLPKEAISQEGHAVAQALLYARLATLQFIWTVLLADSK